MSVKKHMLAGTWQFLLHARFFCRDRFETNPCTRMLKTHRCILCWKCWASWWFRARGQKKVCRAGNEAHAIRTSAQAFLVSSTKVGHSHYPAAHATVLLSARTALLELTCTTSWMSRACCTKEFRASSLQCPITGVQRLHLMEFTSLCSNALQLAYTHRVHPWAS